MSFLLVRHDILHEDNARLKNSLNNGSSNTSNPPSADEKSSKPANVCSGRTKTGRKADGQKGSALTKEDIEEKIRSGKCRNKITMPVDTAQEQYVTKYVVDLIAEPVITEIRIYLHKNGHYSIPSKCRSDVVYGSAVKAIAVTLQKYGRQWECMVIKNDRAALQAEL